MERLTIARAVKRMIVEVNGDELDRALAEDAVLAARSAAAQRGEMLVEMNDYDDSDVETDAKVHLSEKRPAARRRRRPRRQSEDDEAFSPQPPSRKRFVWGTRWMVAIGVPALVVVARHFFFSSADEPPNAKR